VTPTLILSLVLTAASGCPAPADLVEPSAVIPSGQPDVTRVQLGVGETRESTDPRLVITFVRVLDDSRCPTGVTCFWEGDAIVELRVRTTQGDGDLLRLHANPRFEHEAVIAGVRIRLDRLDPYPEKDRAIAAGDYRALLSLGKQ
jgi:hypothetical protein